MGSRVIMSTEYGVIIFYAVVRAIYSIVGNRDKIFVIVEPLTCVIFAGISFVIVSMPFHSGHSGILVGSVYFLTAIGARLFDRDRRRSKKPLIGIIDFTWFCILASILALIIFANGLAAITRTGLVPPTASSEYVKATLSELQFFFSHVIDVVLVLGSILVVCMSIIWSGEVWRKKTKQKEYDTTTRSAVAMVIAYMSIAVSTLVWVLAPMYQTMETLRQML